MERSISAITKGVHHKCTVIPFQWQKHDDLECKVHCTGVLYVTQVFSSCASGHSRRSTIGKGRQAGMTPNTLIAHLWKIAPRTSSSPHEPSPHLANVFHLGGAEVRTVFQCSVTATRIDVCSTLVCTTCLVEWIATSGNVNCPCCSEDCPLVPSHIKPASTVILLLLSDILVHCAGCNRDIKKLVTRIKKQQSLLKCTYSRITLHSG